MRLSVCLRFTTVALPSLRAACSRLIKCLPSLKGAPTGHALPIREIKLSSGAEFIVVICGAVMTMPGLPRVPAADSIKLNKDGEIEGLF